jgi:hypothetical protein
LISKSKENRIWDVGFKQQSSALILCFDNHTYIRSGESKSEKFNENNELELGDNSFVNVEVDCEKKTIYFFINKIQYPYYVSEICSSSFPLLFGFSSWSSPIIKVISLFKILPSSSYINHSVECKPIKWVCV